MRTTKRKYSKPTIGEYLIYNERCASGELPKSPWNSTIKDWDPALKDRVCPLTGIEIKAIFKKSMDELKSRPKIFPSSVNWRTYLRIVH